MAVVNLQELKTCNKCKRSFPATIEHYYENKSVKSGLQATCKECFKKRRKNNYRAKVEGKKTCTKCGGKFPPTKEFFYYRSDGKDRLDATCKVCRIDADSKRRERRKLEQPKPAKPVKAITHKSIDSLKEKYHIGKIIRIQNPNTDRWGTARVTGIYEHYITIQTKNYPTSITWIDMLTGHTPVREG